MPPERKSRRDSFFGLHFDLHPKKTDTALGADITEDMISNLLERVKPDYVQYDCKGHPGYAGYPTEVGTPSPGIEKDSLAIWRDVTRRHGVALFIHYSGVWDMVAAQTHPEWARIDPEGEPDPKITSTFGPYVDELLIPQLKEVAETYDLDGVWVDGECWAVEPDYCQESWQAFVEKTHSDELPEGPEDPGWDEFLDLQREQFERYLTHYVESVHESQPDLEITSNWMYSTFAPDPVRAPLDFLSGDFSAGDSVNTARLEARYLASTGEPWDLMAWGFNQKGRHKTAVQLKQEAAVVLGQGGGFQIYDKPTRRGWIDDWTQKVLAEVSEYCQKRREVSFKTETVPQVAILLSRETYREKTNRVYAAWDGELRALHGALHAFLELGYSVDVAAEHQLENRLEDYPLVVLPETHALEDDFEDALRRYVRNGGHVLCLGARVSALFADELDVQLVGQPGKDPAFLMADDLMCQIDGPWQDVTCGQGATMVQRWATHDPRKDSVAAAVVNRHGEGRIGAIFGPMATEFARTHHPVVRSVVGQLAGALFPAPLVELTSQDSTGCCIDVSVRRKNDLLLIHLANTAGMQEAPHRAVIDHVPPVGPVELLVRTEDAPDTVEVVGEDVPVETSWAEGRLKVRLPSLHLHTVVCIRQNAL